MENVDERKLLKSIISVAKSTKKAVMATLLSEILYFLKDIL